MLQLLVGRFHSVKHLMFSVRLHWKSELNTYRVEASWKLGQWDLLDDYLSSGKR